MWAFLFIYFFKKNNQQQLSYCSFLPMGKERNEKSGWDDGFESISSSVFEFGIWLIQL